MVAGCIPTHFPYELCQLRSKTVWIARTICVQLHPAILCPVSTYAPTVSIRSMRTIYWHVSIVVAISALIAQGCSTSGRTTQNFRRKALLWDPRTDVGMEYQEKNLGALNGYLDTLGRNEHVGNSRITLQYADTIEPRKLQLYIELWYRPEINSQTGHVQHRLAQVASDLLRPAITLLGRFDTLVASHKFDGVVFALPYNTRRFLDSYDNGRTEELWCLAKKSTLMEYWEGKRAYQQLLDSCQCYGYSEGKWSEALKIDLSLVK